MECSSKNTPCPICSRDSDDKCRWNEDLIFCYRGDKFHPPANLSLGELLFVGGRPWKLFSFDSGFADNSYLFVKGDEEEVLAPLRSRRKRASERKDSLEYIEEFKSIRSRLHRVLKIPELENLTTRHLELAKQLAQETLHDCEALMLKIYAKRNRMALKKNTVSSLKRWRRDLFYQLQSILDFERAMLGVPRVPPPRPSWFEPQQAEEESWF